MSDNVQADRSVPRAQIRFLVLIVDMSQAVNKQDMRPTRAIVIKEATAQFLKDFSDQNPLAKVALIVTQNQTAKVLFNFNESQESALSAISKFEGNASMQNSL